MKQRLKKLAARQADIKVSSVHTFSRPVWYQTSVSLTKTNPSALIQKKSSAIRESVVRKYQEIQASLEEDLRITLSHLEMEERAVVSALDGVMEKNCALIQELEQDLARFSLALDQINREPDSAVRNQS